MKSQTKWGVDVKEMKGLYMIVELGCIAFANFVPQLFSTFLTFFLLFLLFHLWTSH